jgi:hypothetical protein
MQIHLEVPNLEVMTEVKRRLADLDVAYFITKERTKPSESVTHIPHTFTTPEWEALGAERQQFLLDGIDEHKAGKSIPFEDFEKELALKGL